MRITSIRISQKHNLGNYEHVEFTAEAVIDEADNAARSTNDLAEFVDWHAQKQTRDNRFREFTRRLKDPNIPDSEKSSIEKWIAEYTDRKSRMEAL